MSTKYIKEKKAVGRKAAILALRYLLDQYNNISGWHDITATHSQQTTQADTLQTYRGQEQKSCVNCNTRGTTLELKCSTLVVRAGPAKDQRNRLQAIRSVIQRVRR